MAEAVFTGVAVALVLAVLAWAVSPIRRWFHRGLSKARYLKRLIHSIENPFEDALDPIFSRYNIRDNYVIPTLRSSDHGECSGRDLLNHCFLPSRTRRVLVHATFGSGKTALSLDLAYQLALTALSPSWKCWLPALLLRFDRFSRLRHRLPVYVHLKQFSAVAFFDIGRFFADWLEKADMDQCWDSFGGLLKSEDVVLILDGLDQLDPTGGRERLRRLLEFTHFNCESTRTDVILTVRSDYLEGCKELQDLTEGRLQLSPEEPPLEIAPFKSVEIQGFDDTQILEYIKQHSVTRTSNKAESIFKKIMADIHLSELSRNPLLLNMLLVRGSEKGGNWEGRDLGDLFRSYIEHWIHRDTQLDFINSIEKRWQFVEDLAFSLLREGAESILIQDIQGVDGEGGWQKLLDGLPSDKYYHQRTRSFLLVNRDGSFMFAHRSMMEYLCANLLVGLLRTGRRPPRELLPRFYSNLIIWFMRFAVSESDSQWLRRLFDSDDLYLRRFAYALAPAVKSAQDEKLVNEFRRRFTIEKDLEARRHILYGLGWLGEDPCDEKFLEFVRGSERKWIVAARPYYHTEERQRHHCVRRLIAFSNGDREFYAARGLYILDLSEVGQLKDVRLIEWYTKKANERNRVVRELASQAVSRIWTRCGNHVGAVAPPETTADS